MQDHAFRMLISNAPRTARLAREGGREAGRHQVDSSLQASVIVYLIIKFSCIFETSKKDPSKPIENCEPLDPSNPEPEAPCTDLA